MVTVSVWRQGVPVFSLNFYKPEITIGRGDDNDIVIPHGTVSRRHARIYVQNGAFYVGDDGSSNGTFVGQQRISSVQYVAPEQAFHCGIFSPVLRPAPPQQPARFGEPMPAAPVTSQVPPRRKSQNSGVDRTAKTIGPGELNVADLQAAMAARQQQSQAQQPQHRPAPPPAEQPPRHYERSPRQERSRRSEREPPPPKPARREEPAPRSAPSWESEPSLAAPPVGRREPTLESEPPKPERRWRSDTVEEEPGGMSAPSWHTEPSLSSAPSWSAGPAPAKKEPPKQERRWRTDESPSASPYLAEPDDDEEPSPEGERAAPKPKSGFDSSASPIPVTGVFGPSVMKGPGDS